LADFAFFVDAAWGCETSLK